ncbi:hypothetical protein ACHAW6_009353 [Cyclotella cf. meneghiniana]
MNLASVAIIAILSLAPSSEGSTKTLSALRRTPNSDKDFTELLAEGGCNPGCDDGYFCVVPDGDCLVHGAVGCNGKTYTDRSFAAGEGVNVAHLGACEETELA